MPAPDRLAARNGRRMLLDEAFEIYSGRHVCGLNVDSGCEAGGVRTTGARREGAGHAS
jgi:hypothetical protein